MWYGSSQKVTLNVDLTRYHEHLIPGVTGRLVPDVKCSQWGWQDRFGAVRFDCCGAMLDIVLDNLTFEVVQETPEPPSPTAPEPWTEVEIKAKLEELRKLHAEGTISDRTYSVCTEHFEEELAQLEGR